MSIQTIDSIFCWSTDNDTIELSSVMEELEEEDELFGKTLLLRWSIFEKPQQTYSLMTVFSSYKTIYLQIPSPPPDFA